VWGVIVARRAAPRAACPLSRRCPAAMNTLKLTRMAVAAAAAPLRRSCGAAAPALVARRAPLAPRAAAFRVSSAAAHGFTSESKGANPSLVRRAAPRRTPAARLPRQRCHTHAHPHAHRTHSRLCACAHAPLSRAAAPRLRTPPRATPPPLC
jgi:hypothetical protein